MSEPSDNSYWMQAIANIPDPKKRELTMAVWQRIQADNPDPQSTDRIYGMFLIFEANGLYLMEFPKKFHQEVGSKLEAQLGQFNSLVYASERQQNSAAEKIEKATKVLVFAREKLDDIVTKVDKVGDKIVREADLPGVVQKLASELQGKCIEPVQSCVRTLATASEKIAEARATVDKSIEVWRRFNLTAMFLSCLILCASTCGFISWIAYTNLRDDYVRAVANEIRQIRVREVINGDVLQKLALWKVNIDVINWLDSNGQPVEGGYGLVLRPAERARSKDNDGVIFFKDQRPRRDNYDFMRWLDAHPVNNSSPSSVIVPSR